MKNVALIAALFIAFFIASCSEGEKHEENRKAEVKDTAYYTNPILAGWYPDPSITSDGKGNFYMVHSTFAFYPGIPIFHSKDLVNWKQIGHVLDRPEQLELEGFGVSRGIFAPDISYHDGVFYVACTMVDGKGNFVVTSKDPAGDWSNPVWLPEVKGIDPGLFFDEDKTYMVYNSDAPDNKPLYPGHRTIRLVELDREKLKVIGDNRILVNGGVDISEKPIWAEGPRIYKLNGYYYLMTAEGGTAIDHSEVVYRTKDIANEFVPYEGNPILTQRHLDPERANPITSAGHADIVQHPNGDWYGIFLACRDYGTDHYNTGRETFLTPVKWVEDWPIFDLGGEGVKYHYPVPEGVEPDTTLFPLSGNFTFTESFEEGSLADHWMFLRTVREQWYSLEEIEGALTMQTRPETISEKNNPSFVGHRQQHQNFEASVKMTFSAGAENEQSGIVAFQNETHYYYLCKSITGGKPVVHLIKGTDAGSEVVASADLSMKSAEYIRLKITSDTDAYRFYYAEEDGDWLSLGEEQPATYLSTRVAGGFVGVTLAMYTSSNGMESANAAVFDWFEYSGFDKVFEKP